MCRGRGIYRVMETRPQGKNVHLHFDVDDIDQSFDQGQSEQDAQLGIESVGHIGKDSNNNNRSK